MKNGFSTKEVNTKRHKVMFGFLVLSFVFLGFAVFYGQNTRAQDATAPQTTTVSDTTTAPLGTDAVSQIGTQVIALLGEMGNIKLDGSLFSDPNFQSLQDYSIEIPPELKGRPNPFDPIGMGIAPMTPSSATSTLKR